ncbi:gluconolactonase [Tistlia consotensis]|uniref:Gluconolactonase n=1 Tax=Tistlia consotensis USBA 355 TaxID=560819 RepID=A0A1Y6CQY2_9PROT|nr:SMP-30/gluconolactonase/LRE family protein [Tistlia consotensis]SMF69119.1 gluconolactonase [Tistlia consotensis USBA 355]SNS01823.1 gluconolactonase [Tistlia consotensis]
MFAPPPVVRTEVFATLPEAYRNPPKRSEWLEGQPGGNPTHSLLEGPSFDRAGNLYLVDIPFGRVFRLSPAGDWSLIADYDGEPNGLKIHRDGRILIADYKNGIVELDPQSGSVTPVLQRVQLERLKAVNDLVFASNGDLYFTDQGLTGLHDPTGRVFCLRADGRVDCLLDNVPSPNGIALSPDESHLYVAVTRANAVWRVPLMPHGRVAKVHNFIQLSGGGGPDGLAVDAEGGLIVCHIGLGVVWRFTARGEPSLRIESCAGLHNTNVAFGGPERRHLFITESESGSILRAELEVPGLRLFSHA